MNWIIIFSCCLVVSIVFLSFFIYAEKLNRILSKKKEKLTLVKYKNKYYIARVLMILLVIAFGTLLTNEVIAFTNNDLDFTYISSYDEYVKNISRFEFNYDNINNDYNVDKASIDGNYLYLLDDGEIVKVDIDGNIVQSKACDSFNVKDTLYTYKDKLIILSFKNKGVKFVIYDKDSFNIQSIYEIQGRYVHTQKSGNIIDLFLYNDANVNPFDLGFRNPIGSIYGKIDKLYVMTNSYISLILSHYKFNLDTSEVSQVAMGYKDLYYEISDYHYLAFNIYNKERKTNKSVLMIYDAEKQVVKNHSILNGNIFKNPVKQDNLNIISKKDDTYYTYIFDSDLKTFYTLEAKSNLELSFNNESINIYCIDGNLYVFDELIGKIANASIINNKLFVNDNKILKVVDLNTGESFSLTFEIDIESYKVVRYVEDTYISLYNGSSDIMFALDSNKYYYGNGLICINKIVYSRENNKYIKIGELEC